MHIEFEKLNGAGNDFVMIGDFFDQIHLTDEQVQWICDRHFGVGADGVIVVKPSPHPEAAGYMDYYNSDGTKAEMCGNGIRCFSKFLVDGGVIDAKSNSFVADTLSGTKDISIVRDADGKMSLATVNMGAPIIEGPKVPTTLDQVETEWGKAVVEQPIEIDGVTYKVTCVSMGNPHAVIFVDDPLTFPVTEVGPKIEMLGVFPEKTNVEFAHVDGDVITMRVWERGCGETLACGTGCCATAVAAHMTGRAGRKVTLKVLGGELGIEWAEGASSKLGTVMMTGPAKKAYAGSLEI
jgi:diaminopimelate epimerase